MSMFYHCPLCWQGEGGCECTQDSLNFYYNEIEKEKAKKEKLYRKSIHDILDKSLDQSDSLYGNEWHVHFVKELLMKLDDSTWKEIKKIRDRKKV